MIYVLCLNPAVDCYERYYDIKLKGNNRTKYQKFYIGGKGINVSLMLNNLGVKSRLLTVLGGFTGDYIYNTLRKMKIDVIAFNTKTPTRINLKIEAENEVAFDIIPRKNNLLLNKIKTYLNNEIKPDDTLIISGSGYGYEYLLENLNCKLVLDVSGSNLKKLIKYKPYLIKPNLEELKDYCDAPIQTIIDKMLSDGASTVLATLGENGSILRNSNINLTEKVYVRDFTTTVGCGDTYLATFIGYLELGYSISDAFKYGAIAAGLRAKHNRFPMKIDIETYK